MLCCKKQRSEGQFLLSCSRRLLLVRLVSDSHTLANETITSPLCVCRLRRRDCSCEQAGSTCSSLLLRKQGLFCLVVISSKGCPQEGMSKVAEVLGLSRWTPGTERFSLPRALINSLIWCLRKCWRYECRFSEGNVPLFLFLVLFLRRIMIVEVTDKLIGVNYIFSTNCCLNIFIHVVSGKELHTPPYDKAHDFKWNCILSGFT